MIKVLASTFLAITGKTIYNTVDNAEFMAALGKHPQKGVIVEVLMDCISQTTNSEAINANIDQYRNMILTAVNSLDGDVIDFKSIFDHVMNGGPSAPAQQVITSSVSAVDTTDHSVI